MKKVYFMAFAATVAMAMTSCSSEDLTAGTGTSNNEATAINFSTYLGRNVESRASITSGGVENFGVFAFYTGKTAWASATETAPNFMNNQEVKGTQSESTWSYSYTPVKYWPNNADDKVSFFAYSPYDGNKTWSDGKISATIATNVKEQKDILFAPAQTDKSKQNVSDKITFAFKHALSRIGLEVAYAKDATTQGEATIEDATTIKVTKVKIGNKTFYASGALNLNSADVAWTGTGTLDYTLGTANFVSSVANKVTNEYQKLNADDSYLMVIPQDLSTAGFPVQITYTVTTTDSKLTGTGGKSEITNEITNTVNLKLEAGKAYTLRLLLGMTSVKVNATVEAWPTDANTDVNLPANTTASSN